MAPVAASTGDWVSVDAYAADIVDTVEKVGVILDVFGDAAVDYGEGFIGLDEFLGVAAAAIETIDTHIVYFIGTVPPDGYAESHRLLLAALDEYRVSFDQAYDGAAAQDIAAIERAGASLDRASALVDLATEALP